MIMVPVAMSNPPKLQMIMSATNDKNISPLFMLTISLEDVKLVQRSSSIR